MTFPPPLVALTPGDLTAADVPDLLGRVRAAVAGGARAVLLREPGLSDRATLALGRELRALLDEVEPRGWLGVHDRAYLVPATNADGVHLGFRSLPPEALPRGLWKAEGDVGRAVVGLSTHAGEATEARPAIDYVFHGPVRPTPSKAGLVPVVGEAGLALFCAAAPWPVWALGGLRPCDLPAVRAAGADGVAVLAGLLRADDPQRAAEEYVDAWGS